MCTRWEPTLILPNTSKYYNLKKDEGTDRSWLSLMLIDELLFFRSQWLSEKCDFTCANACWKCVEYNVLQVMYRFKCIWIRLCCLLILFRIIHLLSYLKEHGRTSMSYCYTKLQVLASSTKVLDDICVCNSTQFRVRKSDTSRTLRVKEICR